MQQRYKQLAYLVFSRNEQKDFPDNQLGKNRLDCDYWHGTKPPFRILQHMGQNTFRWYKQDLMHIPRSKYTLVDIGVVFQSIPACSGILDEDQSPHRLNMVHKDLDNNFPVVG